jgi:hypothetical protein
MNYNYGVVAPNTHVGLAMSARKSNSIVSSPVLQPCDVPITAALYIRQ